MEEYSALSTNFPSYQGRSYNVMNRNDSKNASSCRHFALNPASSISGSFVPDRTSSTFFQPSKHKDTSIGSQTDHRKQATCHYPVHITSPSHLKALVFSGGGVAGTLHVATIHLLVEKGVLAPPDVPLLHNTRIDTLVGVSAGASVALGIATGASLNDLYSFIEHQSPLENHIKVDFTRLLLGIEKRDPSSVAMDDFEGMHSLMYAFVSHIFPQWEEYYDSLSTLQTKGETFDTAPPKQINPDLNCWCTCSTYRPFVSCYSSSHNPFGSERRMFQSDGKRNLKECHGCLTYGLLYRLTGVDLRTIVVDGKTMEPFECSVDSTPDVCVFQATLASMSIPVFFPPVYLVSASWENTYRECRDGGIATNFPMEFAMRTYQPSQVLGSFIESMCADGVEGKHTNIAHQWKKSDTGTNNLSSFGENENERHHSNRSLEKPYRETLSMGSIDIDSKTPEDFSSNRSFSHTGPITNTIPEEHSLSAGDANDTSTKTLSFSSSMSFSSCDRSKWRTTLSFTKDLVRSMLSIWATSLQFSTWRVVPDDWKQRTIFPMLPKGANIHFCNIKLRSDDAVKDVRKTMQLLKQAHAVFVEDTMSE
jgi:predicted acylesterase/phospholipase RssA